MKKFLLFGLLAALTMGASVVVTPPSTGGGGGGGSSGGATTAAMTLYVETTGSDSNNCTSPATACASIQGAVDKPAKHIRHPININVGDGGFGAFAVSGFSFDPASPDAGAYINIQGTLVNATLATGTATGTATAGSAGSGTTFGTLTNSGATWTIDNLRGKLIETTGGTGSGQIRAIVSNTGTVITIAGTWTAPDATTTYAVRDQGAAVLSAMNQSAYPTTAPGSPAAIQVHGNTMGRQPGATSTSGTITFKNLKVNPGGANTGVAASGGIQQIFFEQCSIQGGSLPALQLAQGTSVRAFKNYFSSSSNTVSLGGSTSGNAGVAHLMNQNVIQTTGAGLTAMQLAGGGTFVSNDVRTTSATTGSPMSFTGTTAFGIQANSNRITCASGSSGTIGITSQESFSGATFSSFSGTDNLINLCFTGVSLSGGVRMVNASPGTAWTISNATNGVILAKGAVFRHIGVTFTTVTNEVSVDGTGYTYATIEGMSPQMVASTYGSWFGR